MNKEYIRHTVFKQNYCRIKNQHFLTCYEMRNMQFKSITRIILLSPGNFFSFILSLKDL